MSKLRVLDLFSGIGGFSLGLERTGGFRTVAFCELDPYCRKVLAKHWPGVPIYGDVRTLTAARLAADGIVCPCDVADTGYPCGASWRAGQEREPAPAEDGQAIEYRACRRDLAICGGFPCQDISFAGKGAGIAGERSGLWGEYARLIGEIRPRYAIIENVSALLVRGLGRVLWDLATLGYDAEWHCIPASCVGAPHRRDRIWIVGYPQHSDADDAGSYRAALHLNGNAEFRDQQIGEPGPVREAIPDTKGSGCGARRQGRSADGGEGQSKSERALQDMANPNNSDGHRRSGDVQMGWGWFASEIAQDGFAAGIEWQFEPELGRVAHGVPNRVDRLKGLGNAVVPQIPELIGRAILAARMAA